MRLSSLFEIKKVIRKLILENIERAEKNEIILKLGVSTKINERLRNKTFYDFFLDKYQEEDKQKIISEISKKIPGELLRQIGAGTQSVVFLIKTDEGERVIKFTKSNPIFGTGIENLQSDIDWFKSLKELGSDPNSYNLSVDDVEEININDFKIFYIIMEKLHTFSDYLKETNRSNKIKEYLINQFLKIMYNDMVTNNNINKLIDKYTNEDLNDYLHLIHNKAIKLETKINENIYHIEKHLNNYNIEKKIGNEIKPLDPYKIEIINKLKTILYFDQNGQKKKVTIDIPEDQVIVEHEGYKVVFNGDKIEDAYLQFGHTIKDYQEITKENDKMKIDNEKLKIKEYITTKEELLNVINSSDFSYIHEQKEKLKNVFSKNEIASLINSFKEYLKHSRKRDLDIHIDNVGVKQNEDWLTNPKFVVFDR